MLVLTKLETMEKRSRSKRKTPNLLREVKCRILVQLLLKDLRNQRSTKKKSQSLLKDQDSLVRPRLVVVSHRKIFQDPTSLMISVSNIRPNIQIKMERRKKKTVRMKVTLLKSEKTREEPTKIKDLVSDQKIKLPNRKTLMMTSQSFVIRIK